MSPSRHLFHVNSNPHVSDQLWREWYITEHLPDIVNSGVSQRASLYEEISTPFNANPDHESKFLAIYQTQLPELMKAEQFETGEIRVQSKLFAKEGSRSEHCAGNGDFDGWCYNLIQEFDPLGTGEMPSPQIVTAQMHPTDIDDFEKWYREEHLPLLQKIPGYRRTLRYRLGTRSEISQGEFQPEFLAIHEVDNVREAFGSTEAKAANTTPWTKKHLRESKAIIVRGWNLTYSHGY